MNGYDVVKKAAAELYKRGYITDEEASTLASERLDSTETELDINYPEYVKVIFNFEHKLYSYIVIYNIKDNEVDKIVFNSASVTLNRNDEVKQEPQYSYSNTAIPHCAIGSYYCTSTTVPTSCCISSYTEPIITYGDI
jgi:oligoendopeptidase F